MIFIIFGIISFKDLLIQTSFNKFFLTAVVLICLMFFIGFRYNCDNDFLVYVTLFEIVPVFPNINALFTMSLLQGHEIGFLFVESILKTLGFNYRSIFVFSAIITIIFLYKAFSRLVTYPVLSIFVFFSQYFIQMFLQIRFGIAMAIAMYACSFLSSKNRRIFWFLLFIAILFHFSALGVIFVYFLHKINWNNKKNIFFLFLVCIIAVVLPMRKLLEKMLFIVGIERYQNYITSGAMEIRSLIFNVVIILPLLIFHKSLCKKNIDLSIIYSMAFANIFIGALLWRLDILYRFSIINGSIFCIIIPSYFLLFKLPSVKVMGYYLFLLYCFLKFMPAMRYVSDYKMFIL